MKMTLTLDDEVAAEVQAEAQGSGKSLGETVTSLLRWALQSRRPKLPGVEPFVIEARDLKMRPGINVDRISDLLEEIEGPLHR